MTSLRKSYDDYIMTLQAFDSVMPSHTFYYNFIIEYLFYDKQSYSFYFIDTAIFILIYNFEYFLLNIGIA